MWALRWTAVIMDWLSPQKLFQTCESAVEGEEGSGSASSGKYKKFWTGFGKLLKLGIIEDTANRQRLAKLIRFHTSKSTDKLVSLEEYIERMKPDQKKIYYIIGKTLLTTISSHWLIETSYIASFEAKCSVLLCSTWIDVAKQDVNLWFMSSIARDTV